MKSSKSRYLTSGALGACLFASALTQSLQAIPGDEVVYLENGYTDVGGVLVLDPGWIEDRQDPISFEITEKGGRDAISVTVGYETSDHVRSKKGQSYDTQGKKIVTSDGTNDYIAVGGPEDRVIARASIYLDASYQTQPAYAHLWTRYVTGPDDLTEDGLLGYGILGFTSFVDEESPLNPRFRVWDPSKGDPVTGYLDLPETIIDGYDRWYDLAIEATGECFRFYIDGKFVHELEATTEESYLTHVFLQTYNFASSRWDPVGDQDWTNTEDYTAYFSNLQVVGQSGVATIHAHANYSTLQAAIDAAHEGETVEVQSDYVESININKAIAVIGEELEEGQHSLTGSGGYGAIRISSNDSMLANLELGQGTSTGNIIWITTTVEEIVVAGNTFNIDVNGIESTYGQQVTHLDVGGNTFIAGEGLISRAVYINGAAADPAKAAVDIHVYENTFIGDFGNGIGVGIEGSGEVYYNDFTQANVNSERTLVGFHTGTGQVDGNCFASSVSGKYISGSGGATVAAAYNYFGGEAPAEGTIGAGIVATPYLLSCGDGVYIEAIHAPGGTISPDYAYTNASVAPVFTITPDALSIVEDVLVNGDSVGAVGSYDASALTVDSEITAVFSSNGASITVTTNGSGTVSPDGTVVVPAGDDRSFVLTPAIGYSIGSVEYNGVDITSQVSPAGLLTITNVTGTNALEVTFVGQTFDVTTVKSGVYARYGNVTPASTSVSAGGSVEFTITCPAPFAVRQVKVNGTIVSTAKITTGGTYTVENINSNTTVEFSFGLNN